MHGWDQFGSTATTRRVKELLNEFVSQRSYFLLASLNYLMNSFLGGAASGSAGSQFHSIQSNSSSVRFGSTVPVANPELLHIIADVSDA